MPTTTSTTQNPLWDIQKQYLPEAYSEAQRQFREGTGSQVYTGPRVADFDPVRAIGTNLALEAAAGPQTELADAYSSGLLGVLRGDDAGTQRLAAQAAQAAGVPYATAGTLGSARQALASNRAASDAILGRQFDAYGHIPRAQTAAAVPSGTYVQAGKAQQAHQQALLDAQQAQFEEQQAAPTEHLERYTSALGQVQPSSTVSETTPSAVSTAVDQAGGQLVSGLLGGVANNIIGSFFAEGGEVPMEQPVSARYARVKAKKMGG